MTTRYLTPIEFRSWARSEVADDDAIIEEAIQAAEGIIDSEAARSITLVTGATSATARVFRARPGARVLPIHDADEVTTVVENGTTLTENTHYQLEPLNQIDDTTGDYRPYDRIVRLGACWYSDGYDADITVTAKWGWDENSIPPVVKEACKAVTAAWLKYRNGVGGVVGATGDGFAIGEREEMMVRKAVRAIKGRRAVQAA